jgi:rhodanese-related sulfurtransferase
MKTISPRELHSLLSAQVDLAVIDVRTPVEFAEVHVPQARNEPLDKLRADVLLDSGRLSLSKPAYILCRSGQRAAKAAAKLQQEGLSEAIVVEGGTLAWIDAGLPVERGESKIISLERQVRIAAGTLVFTGVLLSVLVHPTFVWLSGFVGAGLIFAGITDWCGMGLLLAKAPWNQKS